MRAIARWCIVLLVRLTYRSVNRRLRWHLFQAGFNSHFHISAICPPFVTDFLHFLDIRLNICSDVCIEKPTYQENPKWPPSPKWNAPVLLACVLSPSLKRSKKVANPTVPALALTATPTAAAAATRAASATSNCWASAQVKKTCKVYLKGDALFASPNFLH